MHAITGNEKFANMLKSILKKIVKSHLVNLFLVDFQCLKPLCEAEAEIETIEAEVVQCHSKNIFPEIY